MCDETTNTEVCLYDGGDCCQEFKNTIYCQNCSCVQTVDPLALIEQFDKLEIKPFKNPNDIAPLAERWTIKIANVVSRQVCAVLCLDDERSNRANAWDYFEIDEVCRCGWINSTFCPENKVTINWELEDISMSPSLTRVAFVQLNRTVPCSIRSVANHLCNV